MSKGRRKKRDKQPKLPTMVSPSTRPVESAPLPSGVAKLQLDRAVLISKEIPIAAPVEFCFDILTKQLEQTPQWDPIVINARPVSKVRGRIGATSQVTLNLGGKELESLAMISRYHPNRAISWVLSKKPKVMEDWRLEPRSHGTLVGVTVAREVGGWIIGRLLDKIMRRKKVEDDLTKMLTQLKRAVESISREKQPIGKLRS